MIVSKTLYNQINPIAIYIYQSIIIIIIIIFYYSWNDCF